MRKPSMVVHACNPALGKLKQEYSKFKVSLGLISKTLSQETKPKQTNKKTK
jgi:hypothetical protein